MHRFKAKSLFRDKCHQRTLSRDKKWIQKIRCNGNVHSDSTKKGIEKSIGSHHRKIFFNVSKVFFAVNVKCNCLFVFFIRFQCKLLELSHSHILPLNFQWTNSNIISSYFSFLFCSSFIFNIQNNWFCPHSGKRKNSNVFRMH